MCTRLSRMHSHLQRKLRFEAIEVDNVAQQQPTNLQFLVSSVNLVYSKFVSAYYSFAILAVHIESKLA